MVLPCGAESIEFRLEIGLKADSAVMANHSAEDFGARLFLAFRNLVALGTFFAVVVALLRFVDFDNRTLLGIVPIAPILVAVGAVVFAALVNLRAFVAAMIVVVFLSVLALPGTVVPRTGCDISTSRDESGIVVMSHNALVRNADIAGLVAQIEAVDPDVLLLQETTRALRTALAERLDRQFANVETEGLQTIASRWPLSDRFVAGTRTGGALVATVEAPSGPLRVANVHLSAPLNVERRAAQRQEFDELVLWRAEQRVDVLMGDFNASSANATFREIVDDGYLDAHREAGCGPGLTWTRFIGSGPALLSLDHALIEQDTEIESFVVLDYASSDHKAIAVELRPG